MMFAKFLVPLLLSVATNGQSRCRLEDSCAAGLTTVELDICAFTDEDLNNLAACFDNVGRGNIEYLSAALSVSLRLPRNLRRNDLENIPVGFFDGFDALAELNLDFNELIPQAGTFRGLTALDSLILTRNNLDNLPSGFFEGLDSLRELNLFGNGMQLAAGDFIQATSLEVLIFNETASESLPSGVFEGLASLLELDISDNRFPTLPVDIFDDVPNLQKLDISDNRIGSLPDGIFGKLSNLLELKFSRNGFDTWPAGLLDGLTSLTTLSLGGHLITALEAGSFSGTPALEFLDLSSNSLTALAAGTFEGIDGTLIELDVGFNDLTAVPVHIFDDFPSLKILKIHTNRLTLQSDDFEGATSLEELDMSSGIENDLPAGVFDGLTSLRSLDLAFNDRITLLADHFKGASLLERLYLSGNALSTLPTGVFDDLASLTFLGLSSNSMTTLESGTFGGTPALEVLNLGFNDLTTVTTNLLDGLSSLQELLINNNKLATLPADAFVGLVSLVELDLDDNDLSTLPAGLFDGLDSLQELDLDDNDDLQCLPATDAETVTLPDTFDGTTTCGCPEEPVCDEDGVVCDCQPGINGYSCAGPSSEISRALSCPVSDDCTSDEQCAGDEVCCPASQTCEPLLGGMTSACGDPHMTGFRGQKFDFAGEDAGWYALISDLPSFHLNMRVTAPVPDVPEITYITGISLITVDTGGIEHSIALSVGRPHTLDSSCPSGMSACLAEGALSVIIDGKNVLATPGTASAGPGVEISAVNLPGACRTFGFEKYWERKMLEHVRVGHGKRTQSHIMPQGFADAPFAAHSQEMSEWILSDPTATDMMECAAYVADSIHTDGGVFAHQSEHTSFKISTPSATVRVSHGRLHQVAMRDPTGQFDLPDHLTWQMNLAVDLKGINQLATGVLGETFVPTVDASGTAIMNGMEAIRGTQESYRVAGPFDVAFAGSTKQI